ncbi:hypothetical protein [Alkalilimnicola sp. S0819]|uniref:hypothetical protein n=1 Tax=Alkalilimnicola sp. S0819 TaxID=2613922 RepID=UPI0012623F13|nr:hypothetical protein [Alkalilimnicola sp. S0819]KAB7624131.1 hypothetical protein F3N43_07010 [Alkalilimnicola sp. S0819]MPQ16384.1 hypothetical protein [Alkalilimnicola sp. S0819]
MIATGLALALAGSVQARSFRAIQPIATPEALPAGAERLSPMAPLQRGLVERAVRAIIAAWNGRALDPILHPDYPRASRLLDTLITDVPFGAELRLLSLRNTRTLQQFLEPGESGPVRVSRVAAVARTQLEFTLPVTGFHRLPGTLEFIIEIREPNR